MISSVLVNLEAKDKNLSEENTRLLSMEVGHHRYMFDRQQRECDAIKSITRAEWQKHFEDLCHNEVRRVDFRYNSTAHKEQEAASEFKFPNEKRHESIDQFKGSMQWFNDQIKQRYCAADFKL